MNILTKRCRLENHCFIQLMPISQSIKKLHIRNTKKIKWMYMAREQGQLRWRSGSGVKRQELCVPKELLDGTVPGKTLENLRCTDKDDLSFCPQLVC